MEVLILIFSLLKLLCVKITFKVMRETRYISGMICCALLFYTQLTFSQNFESDIVTAAIDRTKHQVTYDGAYTAIAYPNGDVPSDVGVCTDVIIRSYRALGVDLQVLVHEDMVNHFESYPSKRIWGLNRTDRNIDHRRVPNLQVFFTRHGDVLPISKKNQDYLPGDIVTWMLPGNLPHIGFVTNNDSVSSGNPLIVHNVGAGPVLDDMLFRYTITGHYRYVPSRYVADQQ